MYLKRYLFFLLVTVCLYPQFLSAQMIGSPYSGTMRISSDPIGEFNCTLPVDFTNPFTMRRAAWAASDEVNTFATPVVGDFIPGNGQTEVLILSRTRSNDRDPSGFDSEWKWINTRPAPSNLYVTRDIIVYTYDSDGAGGLVKKHTIPTPDLNFEGPSPFLIAKIPGYPNPLVIVATSSVVSRPSTHPDYAKEAALSSKLIAYDINSSDMFDYVWISSEQYGANIPDSSVPGIKYRSGGSPGIANFDLSGTNPYPAVYIYNEIFSLNPATSNVGANLGNNKVFDGGPNLGQGISSITQPGTSSYGGSLSVTVAADVIPSNNTLELICGNTVYEFDTNFNPISKIQLTDVMLNGVAAPDGFTSVANIDQTNGRLDIVVTTQRLSTPDSRLVYVYTIRPDKTPQLLAQKLLNDASEESLAFHNGRLNTSLAFIGDIDGNSQSEIGVTTPLRLWMLSYNGSPILQEKWPPLVTNDESGHTLITMFDFNQDGSQELVYRDEKNLRIINGSGADLVPNQPVWGATAGEGPVIADFNQDGEADIIVTDSQDQTYNVGDRYPREPHAKVVVFKSQIGSPWAPARSVWNQYAYFSFHVNDDLTIPAPQLNHGLEQGEYFPSYDPAGCLIADRRPFNSFLVQRTLYTSDGCFSSGIPIMDAKIEISDARFLCSDGSGTSEISVTVTVRNEGDADMPAATKIEFLIGSQSIFTTTVGAISGGQDVPPLGEFTETITITSSVNDDQAASGLTAEINPADSNGVRDFPECGDDDPVTVDLIPRPVFTLSPPPAICEGDGNVTIEVENNVSDLLSGDEVNWYRGNPASGGTLITNGSTAADGAVFTVFPDFTLQIDNLPASPSHLFYFVDVCSNSTPVEVEVKVDPAPNIIITTFDAVCFGEASGRIEIDDHQPYITYSLDGGTTILTYDQLLAQRLVAGLYTLTAIASLNPPAACPADFPFTIAEPEAITLTNKSIIPPSCELPNGSYTLDFSGGTGPYTLSLTKDGSSIESLAGIPSPGTYSKSDLAPGSYSFTVTDANNCTISDLFNLANDPKLPIEIVLPDQEFCEGQQAILNPIINTGGNPRVVTWFYDLQGTNLITAGPDPNNGNIVYSFNGEGLVISGLPAGAAKEYFIGVSGDLYCPIIEVVSISVLPPLVISISATEIICFGDLIDITATASGGDGNFLYSLNGGPTQSSNVFTGQPAGNYTVTVTSAQNCIATSNTVSVAGPSAPISLSGEPNIIGASCNENNGIIQNVNVTGGWGSYTLEWRKGNADTGELVGTQLPEITGLAPGNYFLIVTDEKGCEEVFPFEVPQQPLPDLVFADQIVCEGEDVTLTPVQTVSGASPTELIWYKDAAATVLLVEGADPSNPAITYTISDESVLLIEGMPAGSYTYYLKVVCTGEIKEAKVGVSAAPNPEFDKVDVLCFGESTGKIRVTANSNPNYRYSVNGAAPVNQAALEALTFAAGTYEIVISDTGSDCTTTEEVIIDQPEELIFTKLDQKSPACGEDDGEIKFQIAGGVETYTITINNQPLSTFTFAEAAGIYTVTALGLGQYDVRITDANGCKVEGNFTLVDDNSNTVESKNLDVVFCEGEVVELIPDLTITGSFTPTFTWYFDQAQTQPITSNYDPSGTGVMYQIDPATGKLSIYNLALGDSDYFLEITNDAICAVSSRADVTVTISPNPEFDKVDVLCFGESTGKIRVIANSNPNYRYSVNGAAPVNQAALEALTFAAGTYEIVISDTGSDCTTTEEVIIDQPEELIFTKLEQKSPACGEDNGEIKFQIAGGEEAYTITINNQPLSTFTFTEAAGVYTVTTLGLGQYDIRITDTNGCKVEGNFTLVDDNPNTVESKNLDLVICKGEVAELTPDIILTGSFTPTFTWYFDQAQTQPITSNYDPSGTGVMYQLDPATGKLTVYNLTPGNETYYLEISNSLICSVSSKADVSVKDFPSSEFAVENILCFGETGKITLVSPAVSDHRYILNGGAELTKAQLEALDLAAGTYIIETKVLNGTCPDVQTLVITQPDQLEFVLNSSLNPSCDEENGDLVFTISGGVEEYRILINGKAISTYSFSEDNNRYVVNKLGPGTYEITVEDANGCKINPNLKVELVNFDAVPITGQPMDAIACEDSPLIFVPDFNAGGVSPKVRWFRDKDQTQEILSNFNPTNTSTVMYDINASTGELKVYNLVSGNYTYYLQLSDPQICTLTLEAKGVVNQGISAEATATPEICFGAEDGSITANNVSGGSGKYEYSLNNTTWVSNPVFGNLAAGTYTLYIRDIDGAVACEFALPNLIVEGPAEPISVGPDFNIINASCDLPNGIISNIQILGGWGNYTVEWRRGSVSGPLITGDASGASDLAPGTYFLLITDEKGCKENFEFIITEQSKPDFKPVYPEKICEFSLATLEVINTVSGSSTTEFTWSKNPNKGSVISNGVDPTSPGVTYEIREELGSIFLDIEGLAAGSYTYYFFVECTGQEIPIIIEVLKTPEPVFDVTSITCHDENNGKITVSSGAAIDITYTLDGGINFITQAELENMQFGPGEYTLQAQNELGCLSEAKILTIINPEVLQIELIDSGDSACNSDSGFIEIEFNGGTPEYTLDLMKDGVKVQSVVTNLLTYRFEKLGIGTYQVEITDTNGCTVLLTSPLIIEEVPTEIIIENVIKGCEEEVITLAAILNPVVSNPVFIWYWNDPKPANKISNNQKIGEATFTIGSNGQISVIGLKSGKYNIWVEATGNGVCEGDLKEVELIINPIPVFTAQSIDENCFGEGGSITLTPAAGQKLIYSINGGAYIAYPTNTINDLKQGQYMVSAQNEFGCISEFPDVLEIKGPQSPISIENLEIIPSNCGLKDGAVSFQLSGGSTDYSILLLDGSKKPVGPAQISTGGIVEFKGLSPSTYQVQITDSKGCILIENGIIVTDFPPVIEANDVVICVGEVAVIQPELIPQLTAPGFEWYYDRELTKPVVVNTAPDQFGATYQISNAGQITATGLLAKATPYSFFIAVNPGKPCAPQVKEVKITVIPLPTLRVSNPSIVCDPKETVNLNGFIEGFNPNLFDYNIISPSGTPMRLDEITAVNKSGNYIVSASVKGRNCFTPTQRILVIIAEVELIAEFQYEINLPGIEPILNSSVQILEDVEFQDISQGDVIIWNWDFGDGSTSNEQNPVHQFAKAGKYIVKLTTIDRFGCQSEYQRVIEAMDDYIIIIPNAFTPDNTKNIFFYPKYRGIASLEFYVFSTWGELIHYSNSLEGPGWDGRVNGIDAMNGNYVYRADFVTNSGERVSKAGVFILIR